MSELTIDIADYLDRKIIEDIAYQELGYAFRRQLQKEADVERILTNLSYRYIYKIVETELGMNEEMFRKKLVERINKCLDDESNIRFEVFSRKSAWNDTESPAVKILDEVLSESKPKIEEAVNKIIDEYPFHELREEILDTIYGCIERKLFNKEDY